MSEGRARGNEPTRPNLWRTRLTGSAVSAVAEAVALLRRAGWTVTPPPRVFTPHQFRPHRKYPWFCDQCGYGPREPLKHIQDVP